MSTQETPTQRQQHPEAYAHTVLVNRHRSLRRRSTASRALARQRRDLAREELRARADRTRS